MKHTALQCMVAPVCALLPNATTVILLAPIIVRVARTVSWISSRR